MHGVGRAKIPTATINKKRKKRDIMKDFDFNAVCEKFKIAGKVLEVQRYGEGHINDTFLVKTDETQYILQRVNNTVFKKPEDVMENILKV